MYTLKSITLVWSFFLLLLAANILFFWINQPLYVQWMVGEDHLTEWLTFTAFFAAAIITLVLALGKRTSMSRGLFWFFLAQALFYMVCAGEEISWGQRVFSFQTPEALLPHNQQQEFNLHNLRFPHYHPRDIFGLYVYGYGVILPLLAGWLQCFGRRWLRQISFRPGIALCFLFAEALNWFRDHWAQLVNGHLDPALVPVLSNQIEETVELYWALSAMFGIYFLWRFWQARRTNSGLLHSLP